MKEEIQRVMDDLETKRDHAVNAYQKHGNNHLMTPVFLTEMNCYNYAVLRLKELI